MLKTRLKQISGEFALVGGLSLVDSAKPVLFSLLAIAAVSQDRGSNLTSLSGRVAEALLWIGHWEKPPIHSYWSVRRRPMLIGRTEGQSNLGPSWPCSARMGPPTTK